MTIMDISSNKYGLKWKGFHYEKASVFNQIAFGACKTSLQSCLRSLAFLLRHAFQARFHPISAVYNYGLASVLQDRLSRNNPDIGGLFGFKKRHQLNQAAALYNCSKSPESYAKKKVFIGLLGKIFDFVIKTAKSANICSADSTGLEDHYVSRHFIKRQNCRTSKYREWIKLLIIINNDNHLIGSAKIGKGPSTDCHELKEALEIAVENMPIKGLLADSGFDAEYNHQLCREQYNINSIIPVNDRNLKYGKTGGYYRRKMKQHFPNKKYGQRWQVESVFSRFKRRLGAYLTARKELSRIVECYLRVLTYDLMILYLLFKRAILRMFSTEQFGL